MNECSLHSEIKKVYSLPGDQFEVKLGNYIVDILRGDLVIEVQTKNFSALKEKLHVLTKNHRLRLVYPLPERKRITHITKDHKILNTRKSPKKGRLTDLFRELVMISDMIGEENFSLEVLLIDEEEVRCDDGKGSWRRRGVSIKNRKLMKVNDRILFQTKADYLKILPEGLNEVFTNRELSKLATISVRTARQITYCLKKGGVIRLAGKNGRELVFQKVRTE
jgi:replication fork clamp-binding protein CrfC